MRQERRKEEWRKAGKKDDKIVVKENAIYKLFL